MQVFATKKELGAYLQAQKKQTKTIGFVPTMGALHDGHLSLIKQCKQACDITVVSIFVNPTQFNDKNDLANYPRNIDKDLKLLKGNCHVVFIPDTKEIYPKHDDRVFDFDGIDRVMEGVHRPGHFNGVAQVVSILFEIVNPDKAFFGQKDFQQVAIIRKMVQKLKLNIEIIVAPIIREPDGLAMSSRNLRLSPQHRQVAGVIHKSITQSVTEMHIMDINQVKKNVITRINNTGLLKVEYFEIVDEHTLQTIQNTDNQKNAVGCIAVWAGDVRLIDNVVYNL